MVTNYHKPHGLKQHIFRGRGVHEYVNWVICSGSYQDKIKVLAGAVVSSDAQFPPLSSLVVGRVPSL